MQALEYRSANAVQAGPNWRRRYLIGVPVLWLCHFVLSCAIVKPLIYSAGYFREELAAQPQLLHVIVGIWEFPLAQLDESGTSWINSLSFAEVAAINALVWGSSGVCFWHVTSSLHHESHRNAQREHR